MKRAFLAGLAGAVVLSTCLLGGAALAQGQAPSAVGIVDLQKAFAEYKTTKSSNDEMAKLVATYQKELEVRGRNKLLNDAELSELVKVKIKDKPSDAENKRADELEKLQRAREDEVNTLSQKADLTDQERARLRELRDLANKNEAAGKSLAEDYNLQVERRKNELQDKLNKDLLAAIAKVAQQKGLSTVVDKVAVLYGGLDITDDVIKSLNGG